MARHLLAFAVLALCSVAALAAKGPADGYFSDWLASASSAGKATSKVSTASAKGYYRSEHEHVCLQETKLRDCRYVGCPSVQGTNGCADSPFSSITCYDCINHIAAVSDLSCCKSDNGMDGFLESLGNVGSCDWDVDLFATTNVQQGFEEWFAPVQIPGTDTFKIGTAWGTCQLSASAENCGHPLCDRMVVSFQGGIYLSLANSRVQYSNFENNERECDELFGLFWDSLTIPLPEAKAGGRANTTAPAARHGLLPQLLKSTGLGAKLGFAPNQPLRPAPAGSAKKAATRSPTKGAKGAAAYDSYGNDGVTIVVENESGFYRGAAVTIMGPFSVVSMHSSVEYEKGMLEYTPIFLGSSGTPGPKNPQLPVVKPDAVRFNFVRNVKAKYGGEYKEDKYYKPKEEYGGEYEKKYYEAKEEYEQRYGKAEEGKEATEGKGEEDYKKMYEAMKGEYEAKYGKLEEKEEGKEGHETEEKKEKDESYYKKDL